jgi:hypothetical protein
VLCSWFAHIHFRYDLDDFNTLPEWILLANVLDPRFRLNHFPDTKSKNHIKKVLKEKLFEDMETQLPESQLSVPSSMPEEKEDSEDEPPAVGLIYSLLCVYTVSCRRRNVKRICFFWGYRPMLLTLMKSRPTFLFPSPPLRPQCVATKHLCSGSPRKGISPSWRASHGGTWAFKPRHVPPRGCSPLLALFYGRDVNVWTPLLQATLSSSMATTTLSQLTLSRSKHSLL